MSEERPPYLTTCLIVSTTLPSEPQAHALAETVVKERLAACGQVVGPVTSHYRWEGKLERSEEWAIHFKTSRSRWPELEARIRALHPYEVPEVIATEIIEGHSGYLRWVEESTRDPTTR